MFLMNDSGLSDTKIQTLTIRITNKSTIHDCYFYILISKNIPSERKSKKSAASRKRCKDDYRPMMKMAGRLLRSGLGLGMPYGYRQGKNEFGGCSDVGCHRQARMGESTASISSSSFALR